jgi:hypothetical protein
LCELHEHGLRKKDRSREVPSTTARDMEQGGKEGVAVQPRVGRRLPS